MDQFTKEGGDTKSIAVGLKRGYELGREPDLECIGSSYGVCISPGDGEELSRFKLRCYELTGCFGVSKGLTEHITSSILGAYFHLIIVQLANGNGTFLNVDLACLETLLSRFKQVCGT